MTSGKRIRGKWNETVRQLHGEGLTISEICKRTGVKRSVVSDTAQRLGLSFATDYEIRAELAALNGKADRDHDAIVMRMCLQGRSDAEIAQALGVTEIRASAAVGRLEMHGRRAWAGRGTGPRSRVE